MKETPSYQDLLDLAQPLMPKYQKTFDALEEKPAEETQRLAVTFAALLSMCRLAMPDGNLHLWFTAASMTLYNVVPEDVAARVVADVVRCCPTRQEEIQPPPEARALMEAVWEKEKNRLMLPGALSILTKDVLAYAAGNVN